MPNTACAAAAHHRIDRTVFHHLCLDLIDHRIRRTRHGFQHISHVHQDAVQVMISDRLYHAVDIRMLRHLIKMQVS